MSGLKLYIDTERVIDAVRAHACIWDPAHGEYKSREARLAAWRRVCCDVVRHYEGLARDDRKELEKRVQQRWRTARDCFVKARVRGGGGGAQPCAEYAYMEQLAFLEPALRHPPPPPPRPPPDPAPDPDPAPGDRQDPPQTEHALLLRKAQKRRAKRKQMLHTRGPPIILKPKSDSDGPSHGYGTSPGHGNGEMDVEAAQAVTEERVGMTTFERQLLAILKKRQTPLAEDDENFFRSLAPLLRGWDAHHKLVFRARVLATAMEVQAQCGNIFLESMPLEMDPADPAEGGPEEPPEQKYRPYEPDSASSANDSE